MISERFYPYLSLDLPALVAATLAALTCALLGNFLVLRRMSLMGDAVSHAVLPGIVFAFLIGGSRGAWPVFIGAACAGIIAVISIETVHKLGRLESATSMGVVFSIMFALGVLLMEQAAASSVDLDVDCLLHGQLELIFWYPPTRLTEFFTLNTLSLLPYEIYTTSIVFLLCSLVVILFYKELKLAAFDPILATTLGFNAAGINYLFMVLLAAAVVASFKIAGSILVISMLICPAATARLLTDRLKQQILLSLLVAVLATSLGYTLAAFGPLWLGSEHSLNAAGMIAVVLGALLGLAVFGAPQYGLMAKWIRNLRLRISVQAEDILARLYRDYENPQAAASLQSIVQHQSRLSRIAVWNLNRDKLIQNRNGQIILTDIGLQKAAEVVRSHRLWESFLVEKAGLAQDHVHDRAEQLEHFTGEELRSALNQSQAHQNLDPHGKPFPEKSN